MNYPFLDGRVKVIQGDQEIARKCYIDSLKLKRDETVGVNVVGINLRTKPRGEAPKEE